MSCIEKFDHSWNQRSKKEDGSVEKSFDKLPPTKNVMYYKILQCISQGITRTNSLVKLLNISSIQSFSWRPFSGTLSFLWSTLPDVVKGCWKAFVRSNLKKSNYTKNYSCKNIGELCTALYSCNFVVTTRT